MENDEGTVEQLVSVFRSNAEGVLRYDAPDRGLRGTHLMCGSGRNDPPPPLYPIRINNLVGYVDDSGTVVVQPQFSDARAFSEGLAAVSVGGRWGLRR